MKQRKHRVPFIASFQYAFDGLRLVWKERNFKVQILLLLITLTVALGLNLSRIQLAIIVLVGGAVLAAEMVNTAFEVLADALHPGKHPLIGLAKDVSAGAVLVMSLAAVIIGCVILGPPLWQWLNFAVQ